MANTNKRTNHHEYQPINGVYDGYQPGIVMNESVGMVTNKGIVVYHGNHWLTMAITWGPWLVLKQLSWTNR